MRFNKLDTGHFFVRLKLYTLRNLVKYKEIDSMDDILKVEGISKNFTSPFSLRELFFRDIKQRKTIRALQNLSFTLRRNKILCVLGPNGAGKTTLLKIIATLILPDEGKILVNGRFEEDEIKKTAGLLLEEERSLYWRLSGRQNLEFFAALYGFDRLKAGRRIQELLEIFKVDYADKRFASYSTGMKKNFALMRALLHNPQLLLLDEPTKSLDYASALSLRGFIKDRLVKEQGKTVVFTTHAMGEARDFADLFMIMHQGKIYGLGTLDELRGQIQNSQASLGQIFLKLAGSNENT
jgi:ABC-2 type transport system ATP-binding protein